MAAVCNDNCGMNYHPGTKYFLKISLDCCLVSCTLTIQTANKLVVCSVFLVHALRDSTFRVLQHCSSTKVRIEEPFVLNLIIDPYDPVLPLVTLCPLRVISQKDEIISTTRIATTW